MFRTVSPSITWSFTLYTQQCYMSYRFADSLLSANLYDIYHCCVYRVKLQMMDEETVRNMQSFIPKDKFEKLAHFVVFIRRIHHDARSPECQIQMSKRSG